LLALALALATPLVSRAETISQLMSKSIQDDDDNLNIPSIFDEEKSAAKSKFLALGLSLLLPGAGQYYTENKGMTIAFGAAEATIWGGFAGMRMYGRWKKEDYEAWAAFHAGADIKGKSDLYFEKMTYYDNVDEYNQLAPLYDGSDAVLFKGPDDYWNWDSNNSRNQYRNLRNQSKNAYRRSLFFVAAALANRIVSGIDAYRAADEFVANREFSDARWGLYYSTSGPLPVGEVRLGVVRRF
jgi:hypothetical protein